MQDQPHESRSADEGPALIEMRDDAVGRSASKIGCGRNEHLGQRIDGWRILPTPHPSQDRNTCSGADWRRTTHSRTPFFSSAPRKSRVAMTQPMPAPPDRSPQLPRQAQGCRVASQLPPKRQAPIFSAHTRDGPAALLEETGWEAVEAQFILLLPVRLDAVRPFGSRPRIHLGPILPIVEQGHAIAAG